MKRPWLIAGLAGLLVSFAVPLPPRETATRSAVKPAASSLPRTARHAPPPLARDWPTNAADIARLSSQECGDALDRLLRYSSCALPEGETHDAAIALTLRLITLSAAIDPARNPLPGRRPPSWLLHSVTRACLDLPSLPPGWMTTVARAPGSREAMLQLTEEYSLSSPEKARALATACPLPWQSDLHLKIREGLAVSDPVAAAREAWELAESSSRRGREFGSLDLDYEHRPRPAASDGPGRMLLTSSLRGPVKETVAALALYGEGDMKDELGNLLRRDAAATRAAVEENGDPALLRNLQKAGEPSPGNKPSWLSPAEFITHMERNRGGLDDATVVRGWLGLAALDPHAAAALRDAQLKPSPNDSSPAPAGFRYDHNIAFGMAATDPVKAFQWAQKNAPDQLNTVYASWMETDGPAALQAVLALPPDSSFRMTVERLARDAQTNAATNDFFPEDFRMLEGFISCMVKEWEEWTSPQLFDT